MADRAELNASIEGFDRSVKALDEKLAMAQRALRRNTIGLRVASVALVGVVLGAGFIVNNEDRITALQQQSQAETARNKTASCAVITLFVTYAPRTLSNPVYNRRTEASPAGRVRNTEQDRRRVGMPDSPVSR